MNGKEDVNDILIIQQRSQILWDLILSLNYAQLGSKYRYIEQNDWLQMVMKHELTIEEILLLDMFDNEQQTALMLFHREKFHLIDLFDEKEHLIGYCLKHDMKVLFSNAVVNNNVDKVFKTTIGCRDINDFPLLPYFASCIVFMYDRCDKSYRIFNTHWPILY
jgi:hypothetical protein